MGVMQICLACGWMSWAKTVAAMPMMWVDYSGFARVGCLSMHPVWVWNYILPDANVFAYYPGVLRVTEVHRSGRCQYNHGHRSWHDISYGTSCKEHCRFITQPFDIFMYVIFLVYTFKSE